MGCTESNGSEPGERGTGELGMGELGMGELDVDVAVERQIELAAPPDTVWDGLQEMLGDEVEITAEPGGTLRVHDIDGDRVGIVLEAERGRRLSFRWTRVDDDEAPSEVEIDLEPSGVGTIVHLRETRLDGAHLERSAFVALARA